MAKRILLTGATGGIGAAIANELAKQGHQLLLVGRDADKLEQLKASLPGAQLCYRCDLCVEADREQLYQRLRDAPAIDVLVNNAGINAFGLFEQQSPAAISQIVQTNVVATMLFTQAMLGLLARDGQLVVVGSTLGSLGYPGYAAYCASKFALRGFCEALRRELSDSQLSISYLAPRATATRLNSSQVTEMNRQLGATMDTPEAVAQQLSRMIARRQRELFIGYPEKLFVWINRLLPHLIDASLKKQLPIIKRFAEKRLARTEP